jgi:uncharacterized phage-associated protein
MLVIFVQLDHRGWRSDEALLKGAASGARSRVQVASIVQMGFRFNEEKSIQLASIFLKMRGGEMKHLKLVKLMYLADREALKRWGHPITGDRYVSMKHGPVLSGVLDLINGERRPGDTGDRWSNFIEESAPHTVKLMKEPGTGALSEAEEELAREIFERFGRMSRWDLVDLTHKFPEYREPDEEHRTWPIRYLDLLKAVGKSEEEASQICRSVRGVNRAKALLMIKE